MSEKEITLTYHCGCKYIFDKIDGYTHLKSADFCTLHDLKWGKDNG